MINFKNLSKLIAIITLLMIVVTLGYVILHPNLFEVLSDFNIVLGTLCVLISIYNACILYISKSTLPIFIVLVSNYITIPLLNIVRTTEVGIEQEIAGLFVCVLVMIWYSIVTYRSFNN